MHMGFDSLEERLSRMQTHWTLFAKAHQHEDEASRLLRGRLLERYVSGVFRYLLAATRDPDVAEDLCQEFAMRFVQGDFRRADPQKGRFRDYLKTSLANLLRDHYRTRNAQPGPLCEDAAVAVDYSEPDADFDNGWREELLARVWESLARGNANYFAVLLCRVENLELSSQELAHQVGARLEREVTAEWVRKTQERAQKKFADLLVEELRDSMDQPAEHEVEQELRELDLLRYCRSALERAAER